ncbi:acyl-CoA dehydrogenase [Geodermatophilus marinus]|uniref:acyl-CoA dehydrogenase n=1 Tax=Geodermatophilus sp. LHW52908 TaxID=2303986 RepID=UPI000E3EA448|nr:acyl-CoA dehydrogenase [Geodermatophilus sp. LHW52908]RFU20549.1 acyl-CoA dehydrogenase [Geodermatophilus sp. LHW52908]
MPLPLTDDQRALADSVTAFARRSAPMESTRATFDDSAAGARPAFWEALLRQGLHALHLPEKHGGADAGLAELAVVVEQLGRALVPGPYVPTVTASAVVAAAGESDLRDELLAEFADGATGVLVRSPGLRAESAEYGWTVSGASGPVLGLPGADVVVVRAEGADGPVWFRVRAAEGTVRTESGTDLTRSVGQLELDGHAVAADEVLPPPEPDLVDLIITALLAAEASGLAGWCLSTAVEYVKTRVQFGKPIGSFQAVQHKAAMLLVRTELITAAAWDAARSAGQPAEQQRLTAAQAALTALPLAIDAALECVTLLGGIGFTWEHDVHLYWRRAISIASSVGTEEEWAGRLGEVALDAERDFSFVGPDALPELRAQVGAVLDEVLALPPDPVSSTGWASARGGPRMARLAQAGLVAPHYPKPYGIGAGPQEQAVIAAEFSRRDLPQPTTIIGEWVLPTILAGGTPAQQERFLAPTLRGEIVWCQLFSEPGAGSDLAGLSTRAEKVEGGWRLNGQKVWTSSAHEADWGVCLARTDPDAPKHKGISYFLVDMRTPGVDVRPLVQSTGMAEFNEVFLDDVVVPDDCLLGRPGEGWKLATTTLTEERVSMGGMLPHGGARLVKRAIDEGRYATSRIEAVRVLARNTAREMSLGALHLRSVQTLLAGARPGAEISVQKVYNALAQREGSRAILTLLGPLGTLTGSSVDPAADLVLDHIALPSVLFGGGTVEIQLNVIAQRILGLPR